jgi:hypothetical protein
MTLHWGDVPTWIAVIVAAIGGTVALVQLRQQSNVLRGEAERNKRRDDLLDGQLRELKDRSDNRVRDQAEHVNVGADPRGVSGTVLNKSRRPITNVRPVLRVTARNGETRDFPPGQLRFSDTDGRVQATEANPIYPVLRPRERLSFEFHPNSLTEEASHGVFVEFDDDADRDWRLDEYMHLERAPKRERPGRWEFKFGQLIWSHDDS